MNKTKIDWCDMSWNPVTGCLHTCKYCYARRIAKRFSNWGFGIGNRPIEDGNTKMGGLLHDLDKVYDKQGKKEPYPFAFEPTFHRYRLDEPKQKTKGKTIFVCSMADLFGDWVPDKWIEQVLKACHEAPQHRYLFLTKNPKRYGQINLHQLFEKPNIWIGTTITGQSDIKDAKFLLAVTKPNTNTFLSIEPIQQNLRTKIEDIYYFNRVKWVIVGTETGNRKDKEKPSKQWILDLKNQCKEARIPFFMKESIRELMGEDFTQEYPWEDE